MPITRKFGKFRRQDFETLSEGHRAQLLEGSCFRFLDGFADVDELRLGWGVHRAELLPEYIAAHPGNRPFGWWLLDHMQERPIINHFDDEAMICIQREKTFGFLHQDIWIPHDGEFLNWLEPQHVYLRRHNLLTPAELAHHDLESEAL